MTVLLVFLGIITVMGAFFLGMKVSNGYHTMSKREAATMIRVAQEMYDRRYTERM